MGEPQIVEPHSVLGNCCLGRAPIISIVMIIFGPTSSRITIFFLPVAFGLNFAFVVCESIFGAGFTSGGFCTLAALGACTILLRFEANINKVMAVCKHLAKATRGEILTRLAAQ